ncbi:hypothetical protein [Pseudomonas sp. NPDC086251]|jgi:hypothetical protein|uniref:hypothetical protein n=1 Tax=Pseudomonas sp. NPDC086251 TaxID=3364431 RepID=UPI0038350459
MPKTTPLGALFYVYDPLSNLTTLSLPTGQQLNHLYYGSDHLHQLNFDGRLISDLERKGSANTFRAKPVRGIVSAYF